MAEKAYVGITGASSVLEADAIRGEFKKAGFPIATHKGSIGILVSDGTISSEPTSNRKYPALEKVPDILKASRGVLPAIHYGTRRADIAEQVSKIFNFRNIYDDDLCRALQLNIDYPDIDEVKKIKKDFPEMRIILPITKNIMENDSNSGISKAISHYSPEYVLIDFSRGRGKEMRAEQIERAVTLYREIKKGNPEITVGFAGGLCGLNVGEKINELGEGIGSIDFSIDAEKALRDELSDKWGDDALNLQKVHDYIFSAHDAFLDFRI